MKRLETTFVFTSIASNDITFEVLSGLTNLEHLDVGHDKHDESELSSLIPSGTQGLRWSLGHNSSRLSTLRKLRTVTCMDAGHNMEEDLQWMQENWPVLEDVRGSTLQETTNMRG